MSSGASEFRFPQSFQGQLPQECADSSCSRGKSCLSRVLTCAMVFCCVRRANSRGPLGRAPKSLQRFCENALQVAAPDPYPGRTDMDRVICSFPFFRGPGCRALPLLCPSVFCFGVTLLEGLARSEPDNKLV